MILGAMCSRWILSKFNTAYRENHSQGDHKSMKLRHHEKYFHSQRDAGHNLPFHAIHIQTRSM